MINPLLSEPVDVQTFESVGHWGVVQPCSCHSILDAIASLLEGQRPDLAMVLIDQELNSQT